MKDYYKELRKEVRTNKKQLQKIETKKQMLEYMKRYMSKEEYEEELRKIEIESNHIYQSIALANEKLSTPKVTENYFNTIEKLVKLYQETNDVDFKKVISDVINEKRNEVIRLNEQLPEELQGGLDDLYGSVVIKDDSELSKISKSKEIFESIKRDNYKKQAKIVRMIGTTYNSNSETDQQLREKYVEELRDAKEEIAILDKYLSRMNKEYNEKARILKEAAVAKVTPKAYKNILNYSKNAEQLERICNNCGITSLKDRYGSNLDSSKVEKYKKKIATYLKKKIQSTEKKAVVEQPKVAEKPAKVKESEPVVKPIHKPVVVSQPKEEKKSTATDDSKKKIEEKINNLSKQEIEKKLTEPPKEYGYNTIIQNLVKDLEPKKYDGVGYEIYNLKVKDNFKKEINTGNYLYNIAHVVPAIVKLPFIGIQKIANRFLYRKSAIDRMSTIKQRLEALPEKDLEILLKEYKNHVETEKYGSGLNILINERLEKYTNDKVEKINKQIEKNYEDLFDTMNKVQLADSKARDKSLSDDERYEYILMKKALLKGKAQQVKSVRDDYNTAKDLISNGMDGFTKAAKDSALKNSYVGYFFTRERKLDTELLDREAALERAEMTAIARDDDEMALRVFVEHEKLLCKNTMIKNSIFGKRSVGKKYYQPLAEKLEGVRVPFSKKKKVTYGNSAIDTVEKYSEIQKKFIR